MFIYIFKTLSIFHKMFFNVIIIILHSLIDFLKKLIDLTQI
jgi:hypothetical protein